MDRLLKGKLGGVSLIQYKVGNLCAGKWKIHLLQHIQDDQFIQGMGFSHFSRLLFFAAAALPRLSDFHFMVNLIQYGCLAGAPERSNQKLPGTVACQTMDGNIRAQPLDAGNHQIRVFFQGHDGKKSVQIISRQIGSLQNMQQLQLDSLNI